MKFSLLDYKRDHLDVKAHNAYIQAMGIFEVSPGNGIWLPQNDTHDPYKMTSFQDENDPRLISACREGTVKFYDINRPQSLLVVDEVSFQKFVKINKLKKKFRSKMPTLTRSIL